MNIQSIYYLVLSLDLYSSSWVGSCKKSARVTRETKMAIQSEGLDDSSYIYVFICIASLINCISLSLWERQISPANYDWL